MAKPFLALPTGLIGTVGVAKPLYREGRPFYPFLYYEQFFIILAIVAVAAALVFTFATGDIRTGVIIGGVSGLVPSILASAPYKLDLRTSRPIPWINFTREYLAASNCKLASEPQAGREIWKPALSAWRAWRNAKLTIIASDNGICIKGPKSLVLPLARNWKRIAELGPNSA